MIIWGHYHRDRCEDTGSFECPACAESQPYTFIRTYRYFHIWFVPLFKEAVVAEYVACSGCNTRHSLGVLRNQADVVDSPFSASGDAGPSLMDQFGNVVALSQEATAEILRRRQSGGYDDQVAVRIQPEDEFRHTCRIGFDVPEADGRDWIGESNGLTILIDRRDASVMHGATIQYRDGRFQW